MNPFISDDKKISLTFIIGGFALLVMATLYVRGLVLGHEVHAAWLDWSLGIVAAAMGIRSFQKTAWKAADAYATVKRVVPEPAERPEIDLTKASQQDENDHTPDVPVEKFHKPAEGRITSHFRSATRPNHHGIDIAKAGDVPIYAIADGEVMRSYNGGNGGETIITQHNVDGQYYLTLNAHLRVRNVKTGEKIKRGQIIGYMGNTGRSTGQHLHFEIHRGVWNSERSNAVNPLKYFTW